MARLLYVHWNRTEANERARKLRDAGHTVRVQWREQGEGLEQHVERPPEAIVIDLDRLPSHGRAVATYLRQRKSTRQLPIVFVGGDEERVARARRELPDATYATWRGIRGAITRALAAPPTDPRVPDTMAGYSGTPLPKKLGVKPGTTLTLLGAPDDFEETLGELPEGVTIRRRASGRAERVIAFLRSEKELHRRLGPAERALAEGGGLWLAWPKKASGVETDLTQASIRRTGLDAGLVDYKICAIDATWSGLCFARRSER